MGKVGTWRRRESGESVRKMGTCVWGRWKVCGEGEGGKVEGLRRRWRVFEEGDGSVRKVLAL